MDIAQRLESIEPGNFAALDAAIREQIRDEDPLPDDDQQDVAEPKQAAAPEDKPAADAAKDEQVPPSSTEAEDKPAGIATRDGKHVIPYTVLEQERAAKREAEAKLAELQQQLEQMRGDGATKAEQQAAVDAVFSEDELAELAESLPAFKKLHDAYQGLASKLTKAEQEAARARQLVEQRENEAQQAQVQAQVTAALKTLPLLSKWQQVEGGLWAEAVEFDKTLAADPAWAGKTLAERFAHVQREIAARYDIPIPSPTKTTPKAQPRRLEPEERTPQTLSDMAGNAPVLEADEANALSTAELRAKFSRMSNDQINEFLRRAAM